MAVGPALKAVGDAPRAGVEVQVGPAGAQRLALPDAHRQRHRPPRGVPATARGGEDLASLGFVERDDLLALQRRGSDERGDVA